MFYTVYNVMCESGIFIMIQFRFRARRKLKIHIMTLSDQIEIIAKE